MRNSVPDKLILLLAPWVGSSNGDVMPLYIGRLAQKCMVGQTIALKCAMLILVTSVLCGVCTLCSVLRTFVSSFKNNCLHLVVPKLCITLGKN